MKIQLMQPPELDEQSVEGAFKETAFLLEMFAGTINEIMGGATSSVGRLAGRHLAKKMPIYLSKPTIEAVLQEVANHFKKGFDIEYDVKSDSECTLSFKRCAIRDVCHSRGLEPGDSLCRLFHHFMDGIINELYYRPVKSELIAGETECKARSAIL